MPSAATAGTRATRKASALMTATGAVIIRLKGAEQRTVGDL